MQWKPDWLDTKERFIDWQRGDGLLLGASWPPLLDCAPREAFPAPREPESVREAYENAELRAQRNHWTLARQAFPADVLPVSDTDIGPGSLALFLGAEPGLSKDTVWFEPSIEQCARPEALPPLRFDPESRWWRVTEATLRACAAFDRGKYLVGCPDLVENVDILAALRGPQTLLADMIERPEWVEEKIREINVAWFEAYDRIYEIIRDEDGGSAFGAFRLWGPGRTAKVQCDACLMFSPAMFQRFVAPSLKEQCERLDFSMYHLDGTGAMRHLDALLGIEALGAIEWTPEAGLEGGGDPRWFDLYRRVLDAGKSLQIVSIRPEEIVPVLDAVGGKGVYFLTSFRSEAEAEATLRAVEPYR